MTHNPSLRQLADARRQQRHPAISQARDSLIRFAYELRRPDTLRTEEANLLDYLLDMHEHAVIRAMEEADDAT